MAVKSRNVTQKKEIVDQAYAEGADKKQIAKENGITLSTLYGWRNDLNKNGSRKASRTPNAGPQAAANGPVDGFLAQAKAERVRLQELLTALDTIIDHLET
jgi:transposase